MLWGKVISGMGRLKASKQIVPEILICTISGFQPAVYSITFVTYGVAIGWVMSGFQPVGFG